MQKNYILPIIILMFLLVPIASAMDAVNVINPPGSGSGNTYINNTYITSQMNQTPNQTPGQSATIVINSTTTLAAGAAAFVTNIGTSLNAIWDIGIPQGTQGEPGAAGYTPVKGVDYFDGINGTNGTFPSLYTLPEKYPFNSISDNDYVLVEDYTTHSQYKMMYGNATPIRTLYGDLVDGNLIMTVDNNGALPYWIADAGISVSQIALKTDIQNTSVSISVNATFTGLPSTNANVTNVGNETNALLDFTIPQGLTGDTGAAGATGGTGGQILYFRHANSTEPITYEGLIPVPAGATEVDEVITIKDTNGKTLVDSYITDVGYPALTEYPAGLWRFRTFGYVGGASGTTTFVFDVYNRTAGGTETLLFTATSEDINALVATEYLTSYVQTMAYPVALTDRIVVKVSVQTTHSANVQIHWVYEGTTHTSHIQTTLASAPDSTLSFNVIAGETLYKGEAVYISSASGGNPVVSAADNTVTAKSRVVGIMESNTASGARGIVRRAGALTVVDTRSTNTNINPLGQTWSAGDLLFATTGGGLTNVRPTSGRSVKAAYTLAGSSATDVLLVYPMENPVWITAAAAEDVVLRMGDTTGTNKISFRNYTNGVVAYVSSFGKGYFNGTDMGGKNISSVLDPISPQDAATKNYVDTKWIYGVTDVS